MPSSISSDDIDISTTPSSDVPSKVAFAVAVSIVKLDPSPRVTVLVPSRGNESAMACAKGS